MRVLRPLRLLAAAAMLVALVEGPGCALVAGIEAPVTDGTCTDGKNTSANHESGVDCGGACLGACPQDPCSKDVDCASFVCSDGKCASPDCHDNVWNGTETDLDCGGTCDHCGAGKHCSKSEDCAAKICLNGLCPRCMDSALSALYGCVGSHCKFDCFGMKSLGCQNCVKTSCAENYDACFGQ